MFKTFLLLTHFPPKCLFLSCETRWARNQLFGGPRTGSIFEKRGPQTGRPAYTLMRACVAPRGTAWNCVALRSIARACMRISLSLSLCLSLSHSVWLSGSVWLSPSLSLSLYRLPESLSNSLVIALVLLNVASFCSSQSRNLRPILAWSLLLTLDLRTLAICLSVAFFLTLSLHLTCSCLSISLMFCLSIYPYDLLISMLHLFPFSVFLALSLSLCLCPPRVTAANSLEG